MRTRRAASFLLLFTLLSGQFIYAQEPALQGFDDYVNKALKDWQVPGVAIAIIKNDKIILAKGYGVKKVGDPAPVSEKTIFAIGSASKAFTAASAAMLVDEGKIKWDDPATKYLPGFQLYDPAATRELTVRDLLCHRSGLERGDLMWYGSAYGRDEILQRVRYLKPSWSFRSQFGYQNIMYLAAGQAVAGVSKMSWDDVIKQRIFKPLGMTSSNTSIKDLRTMTDVATPHGKVDSQVVAIPWRDIDNIAPAGSINSNVLDMAQWVRLHLNEGKANGQTLITSGSLKEMHTPQTIIRREGVWEIMTPEAHFMAYGLGWFLHDYKGRKVIQHGGNIDGMSALVAMIPEEKLGLVILTNMNGTFLTEALAFTAFDYFLPSSGVKHDHSAEILKSFKALEAAGEKAEKKREDARVKGTQPSLELKGYSGTYTDQMYGDAKVVEENGKLVLSYGAAFKGDLEHWHYNTFRATWRDRTLGKSLITFNLNAAGKADGLNIENLADFKRTEKVEDVASLTLSEDELKKYLGKYELKTPPLEISVEMIGGKLKGVIPGQPVATFVPIAANRFKVVVDGAPVEIFAQFEMEGAKPKSLTIDQGGVKLTLAPKS
jgi:CubicO group peptidase (beta-lactamase class C family)